jgi:predicted PurR-regulated permease PerM
MVKSLSKNKGDVAYVHERVIAVYSKLQLRLKGQLFLMLYVGLLAYTGFWILHGFGIEIEKKELLALMAGVTEIVPYLGPLLGAIPALLVATLSHGLV